jgi:hypothetical protein
MYQVRFKDVVEFRNIPKPGNLEEKETIIATKEAIQNLLNMPIKNAQLNYDVTSKFKKAIDSLGKEFNEQRINLLEKYSVETETEKGATKFKVVDGKVQEGIYNVSPDVSIASIYDELFDLEVEFNCYKLKRSRFNSENLAWESKGEIYHVSLGDLELFIDDDIVEN